MNQPLVIPTLTLYQYWASFMAWKEKQIETRSWYPGSLRVGQIVAIHAGKTIDPISWVDFKVIETCKRHGIENPKKDLPRGFILCLCQFQGAFRSEYLRDKITPDEAYHGNYSNGRWGWRLKTFHVFDTPIRMQGNMGLWKWRVPREIEIPPAPELPANLSGLLAGG